MPDAFDRWMEWVDKPLDDMTAYPAELYDAIMALPPELRLDRRAVNDAVKRVREADAS